MKDNSDIPLPLDQLRSRVLVFAIIDDATHEYEEITKGYVQLSTDEDGKNHTFHYLQVKDEQTNEVLMRSNLKIENNFGKQKGSIISWTDNQQPQYQEIALSFQKDRECDMFWRTICEKIGKSYLEINGMQKLETPTVNNLNFILQKAKNSIDLMDYNIVHSETIIQGLGELFYEMHSNSDEFGMGTIYRIFNAILSPAYSSNAIQTLLSRNNFYLMLDLQEFRKGIAFRSIYEQKVGQYLSNKFSMPSEVFEKIELSHRAIFYRENVLELAEDGLLESLMFMAGKEAQVEIVSFLNRSKFLETLIGLSEYPKQQQNELESGPNNTILMVSNSQLVHDKLQFLHEAIIMQNQVTGEQLKQTFKQNLYISGVLAFVKDQIELLNPKALEILFNVAEMDKLKFFEDLIEKFKVNSSDNLLKSLMKVYLNSREMRSGVVALIEVLVPLFNLKRELLDFFIGTFVCSVFAVAKDPQAILVLSNVLLALLQNSSILFPQLTKLKICQKLAFEYRNGVYLKSKSEQLEFVKFLKYILIEQSHKGPSKNKQIQKNLINSGIIECCMMVYMKHSLRYNVISSSMLENLKIIEKMDSPQLHAFIIKEYASNQNFAGNQSLLRILAPIKTKYFEYMNKKTQQSNQQQNYLQLQRIVHEEILLNEQQDTYLMNQDYEEPSLPKKNQAIFKAHSIDQNPTQISSNHTSNHLNTNYTRTDKEDSLMFLKRMMDEIKEDDEEEAMQREPRKIVKRSEDSKETAIEFCFDLPDMDQITPHQLQGT